MGETPAPWDIARVYRSYVVALGKMLPANRVSGESSGRYLRNLEVRWDTMNVRDHQEMASPNRIMHSTGSSSDERRVLLKEWFRLRHTRVLGKCLVFVKITVRRMFCLDRYPRDAPETSEGEVIPASEMGVIRDVIDAEPPRPPY